MSSLTGNWNYAYANPSKLNLKKLLQWKKVSVYTNFETLNFKNFVIIWGFSKEILIIEQKLNWVV